MYKIISWYLRHLPFPHRGWKYFRALLRRTGLYERDFIKKLHNGRLFRVCAADHIRQQILWYGYYEKDAVRCWEALAEPNMIVIDAGANTGYYSVVAAARKANVFAFEPASNNRKELEANISLNPGLHITVSSSALSNKNAEAIFYIAGKDNSGMSGLQEPENFSGTKEMVRLIRFDDWRKEQGIGSPGLIKIDTEGAEMDILEGMRATLLECHPLLFIEVMPEHLEKTGHTVTSLFSYLSALQYEAFLPVAPLLLKRLQVPAAADVVIFAPAGHRWHADFRIQS